MRLTASLILGHARKLATNEIVVVVRQGFSSARFFRAHPPCPTELVLGRVTCVAREQEPGFTLTKALPGGSRAGRAGVLES